MNENAAAILPHGPESAACLIGLGEHLETIMNNIVSQKELQIMKRKNTASSFSSNNAIIKVVKVKKREVFHKFSVGML